MASEIKLKYQSEFNLAQTLKPRRFIYGKAVQQSATLFYIFWIIECNHHVSF